MPEEFVELGCPGRGNDLFSKLQNVGSWKSGRPDLGARVERWLSDRFDLALPTVVSERRSNDGSTKLALGLADGKSIEAVHMPRAEESSASEENPKRRRVTFCISSQVGCAMGCTFCATATLGIVRNLSAGEIVAQVLALMARLGPARGEQVHLVFMGMGEPLHNLNAVERAITVLCRPEGARLGPRRITVSTSGLVAGIERLAQFEPRPQLAISLNASSDESRSAIMPVNRGWNLARLREAVGAWPLRPGERLSFEYVMLAGVNDSLEDADRVADWLGDLRHRHNVNLIPWNEHPGTEFQTSSEATLQVFLRRLRERGCFVSVRRSRGRDVEAACGQLVALPA